MTGQPIKLLLDEHIWEGLAEALGLRGYDVVHISHTELRSIDDEPLLAFAAAEGRAVLTYNARHFVPLVRLWYEARREHAGVILSVQLPPGELLRQVERLLATLSADALKNTVRWLQEFKSDAYGRRYPGVSPALSVHHNRHRRMSPAMLLALSGVL